VNLGELKSFLFELFGAEKLADETEWGFTVEEKQEIRWIGYATNLTPETVEAAAKARVDLLLTHHDAWDFIYGMREFCQDEMRHRGMSHLFVHLPLDDADFGTSASLVRALGATVTERTHQEGVFCCGAVGEFSHPVQFQVLAKRLEALLAEPVQAWRAHDRMINRICAVTGGGHLTSDLREAVDLGCDAYITGEKVIYTVQYARFAGIDLFVGSHTFTEILGVQNLARKIKDAFPGVYIERIPEAHLETGGRTS